MKALRVLLLLAAGLVTLGTLPLTVSRGSGWTSDLGIVLTAFAPYAVVSYAVALGLVTLAVLAAGRRVDHLGLAAAVVLSALVLVHGAWVTPLVLGGAPEPAADGAAVTVLAANVLKGQGDAEQLVGAVRDHGADVLVLSEVTPRFLTAADAAGLAELLPHRAGRPGETTEGTVVLSSRRVRAVATVATTFDSLVVRTHGLTLLGTHPAPPTSPDDWRRDQPLLLAAALQHDVDVVAGDLNATLDHPTVRDLVEAGWRSAVELANDGWQPTWPVTGSLLPVPAVQIDHVLVEDDWAVTGTDTVRIDETDHLAVVAELRPAA